MNIDNIVNLCSYNTGYRHTYDQKILSNIPYLLNQDDPDDICKDIEILYNISSDRNILPSQYGSSYEYTIPPFADNEPDPDINIKADTNQLSRSKLLGHNKENFYDPPSYIYRRTIRGNKNYYDNTFFDYICIVMFFMFLILFTFYFLKKGCTFCFMNYN